MSDSVKLRFPFTNSRDEEETETMWAIRREDGYEIDVEPVQQELIKMGCSWEGSDVRRLIAVDVPPEVPYGVVKAFLERGEAAGTFEYQEACLGFL